MPIEAKVAITGFIAALFGVILVKSDDEIIGGVGALLFILGMIAIAWAVLHVVWSS